MQDRRGAGGMQGLMRAQVQAGLAALQQGNTDDARNIFTTLIEANPQMAVAHVGLGRVYSAEGDHQRALEHFQHALEIKPDFAPAIMFSAEAREKLGETDGALTDYQAAVELDPSLGFGYQRMARLLVKEDRDEDALKTLLEAVQRSPQDVGLRLMLANALERSGGDAVEEYQRAIDLKPDLWIAHYQLGKAHLQAGRFGPARDALTKAATLAADKAQVHQALGAALTGLGEHARAAKAFDEAYRLKPTNLRAVIKAAQARSHLGRHRDALDLLLGLGRMARRSGLVQKAIGDIYMAMGKPAEAVDCYRAMVLNAPDMQSSAPEIHALATAQVPADIEAYAHQFHDALEQHATALGQKVRSNPKVVREWLKERRSSGAVN